jgi:hypothetical protein
LLRSKSFALVPLVLAQVLVLGPGPARAAAVAADYRFQNSFASSVGTVPDLTEIGHGSGSFADEDVLSATRTVLRFPRGNGVVLSPATGVINTGEYTIEVLFRFHRIESWRKIIDFKNGTDDSGLYSLDGHLNFFPTEIATSRSIEADTYAQVVLTRVASGKVAGYVNGVRQFSFRDVDGFAVIDPDDTLRFFKDDKITRGEQAKGAVSRIRLYDGALTPTEVAALACQQIPNAICGSDADDQITGTAGDEIVLAGAGDDTVDGGGGNDILLGQAGADTLAADEGRDHLQGGTGPDELDGGAGNDFCSGGPGGDRLRHCEHERS